MRIGHAPGNGHSVIFSPFPSSVNFVKIVIKRGIYVVPHKLYPAAGFAWMLLQARHALDFYYHLVVYCLCNICAVRGGL